MPDASHPVVVLLGWISVVTGYFVVNHTQTMKLFGVRSMWDLKMAALLGGGLITASFFFSGGLGILGRNLFPDLAKPDMIYPKMVNELLAPGLKGLVVAGLLAASISTFTGIGAALSALFTRDGIVELPRRGWFVVDHLLKQHPDRPSKGPFPAE